MSPRRVLLWRHGRTSWNVEHRFQGQSDPPLDEVGRAQAAAGARLLAAYAPDAVVSSDLRRAVQTARPLVELLGRPVVLDARLRERSLGRWEGLTRDEVGRRHPEEYAHWLAGRQDRQDGSEPRPALAERALAALDAAPGDTVVLVTHSATALALTGRLLGLPVSGWRAVGPLGNGRWSELTRDEHGWRLQAHNLGPLAVATDHHPGPTRTALTDPEPVDAGPPADTGQRPAPAPVDPRAHHTTRTSPARTPDAATRTAPDATGHRPPGPPEATVGRRGPATPDPASTAGRGTTAPAAASTAGRGTIAPAAATTGGRRAGPAPGR